MEGSCLRHVALAATIAFGCSVAVAAVASADQATSNGMAVSPNVNVLRGIDDAVHGDALLQRQNEPVAAVSTRNPNHVFIAANDYRTVDLANDLGLGNTLTRLARHIRYGIARVVAALAGRREFEADEAMEKTEAGAEAWIGLYLSNDGGKSY
jgi:hypothetical protein